MELTFKEGDDVILYYGIGSRHMKRTKVKSVYKTNNFILEGVQGQFRQTGFETTYRTRASMWVKHVTDEELTKLARYQIELGAEIGINKVKEAIKFASDEDLKLIAETCLKVMLRTTDSRVVDAPKKKPWQKGPENV